MDIPLPPHDLELKNIIDKLAQFVARNGPEFECMTKNKQQGNPKFSFLYGGEYYQYYQYRVLTEQSGMKQHLDHDVGNYDHNSWSLDQQNAHSYPTNPTVSFNQTKHLQSQQDSLREQIKQSEQNLSAQHAVLLQKQQADIEDLIKRCDHDQLIEEANDCCINLHEIFTVLQPIIDSCTKDSISNGKAWFLQHASNKQQAYCIVHALLLKVIELPQFSQKLHVIYLVNDLLHHCARKNACDLKDALESVVVEMFCNAYSVASDEQREKLNKLLKLWQSKANYLSADTLDRMHQPVQSYHQYQSDQMAKYSNDISTLTQQTKATLDSYQSQHQAFVCHAMQQIIDLQLQKEHQFEEPADYMADMQPPPPPSISPNCHGMMNDGNDQEHIPFHTEEQLQHSQQQQQQQQQQHCSGVDEDDNNVEVPIFTQPPPLFYQPPPNIFPDFSKPPPNFHQASLPPFDSAQVQEPQQPQPLQQPQQQQQSQPQPTQLFPPSLLSESENNCSTEDVAPTDPVDELIPTVPYYDLPAGLMVPLIKLEDTSYKPLDPKDIRLPPPAPPSERLLAAVEAFYALPSHDRPRDSEGWEKLGLYEFYKAKNNAKRLKEEQIARGEREKSRTPSPVTLPLEREPSPPRRRYRSRTPPTMRNDRSSSLSPPPPPTKEARTIGAAKPSANSKSGGSSPSRTPRSHHSTSGSNSTSRNRKHKRSRRSSSSESLSPNNHGRSPNSASMQPLFGPVNSPPYSNMVQGVLQNVEEIDASNKGHQMLRKMGWGGSGLGAKEQGIDTPISGGEVRDKQEQFRGIGCSTSQNDPYENFRKNKGAAFITRMKARAEERAHESKIIDY